MAPSSLALTHSQPVQQRPDSLDIFKVPLGLQVVLRGVVPGVDQAEVLVEGVRAVDEVLERLPDQPLDLQVFLRRGISRLLSLGDLLVFLVGEVPGFQDVD